MCSMVAAAHSQSTSHDTNPVASLVNSLALAGHCGGMPMPTNGASPMSMSHIASMRSISSPAGKKLWFNVLQLTTYSHMIRFHKRETELY